MLDDIIEWVNIYILRRNPLKRLERAYERFPPVPITGTGTTKKPHLRLVK